MKISSAIIMLLLVASLASGKEKTYTASTPAAPLIRSFLGISLSDSIDFIRWKVTVRDNNYMLTCNFGIGKPNTNGFLDNGKKIELSGTVVKQKSFYQLLNGQKTLKLAEINADLLHFLDADNSLLVGNGGWSYTLNNITPSGSDQIYITTSPAILEDSMVFEGRSPCNVPGVIAPGTLCYKLKWRIVLYANAEKNIPRTYKAYGTPYRREGSVTGAWEVVKGKDERIVYQLNNDAGNGFLYLLKLDEHILVFTDAQGKLLVGDEDFSYTLNAVL